MMYTASPGKFFKRYIYAFTLGLLASFVLHEKEAV